MLGLSVGAGVYGGDTQLVGRGLPKRSSIRNGSSRFWSGLCCLHIVV